MTIPSYPLGVDGIRVHEMRTYLQAAGERALRSHRHEFWQCIVFTSGTGAHDVDLISCRYTRGSVVMLAEGAVHRFIDEGSTPDGVMIHFTKQFFTRSPQDAQRLLQLRAVAVGTPLRQCAHDDMASVLTLLSWLTREATRTPKDVALLRTLVHALVLLFRRWGRQQQEQDDYQRFIECVELRYARHDSVPLYAQALQMSEKKLYAVCHDAVGKPPGRIIDDRLLLEAKRLLVHSTDTVAVIGFTLGFEDPAYFSRFFKQRMGQPPGAFRKQQRNIALSQKSSHHAAQSREE